jgi:hypothetical protein
MKKEATQKMKRGLSQRPPIKKEATPKNAKGPIKKDIREKIGNPKTCNIHMCNTLIFARK